MAIVSRILGWYLILAWLLLGGNAQAGELADRLVQYPNWDGKPPVAVTQGDLLYPDWMKGTWNVTSTLVEQIAPLAPQLVTPGFESNRRYLNQPVSFQVRFQTASPLRSPISDRFLPLTPQNLQRDRWHDSPSSAVVADREFNGLNIAKAYLGDRAIQSVQLDPKFPNRQITLLRSGRQLISTVTGHGTETPDSDRFIATEITNQFFRGTSPPYFNQVETTTAYKRLPSPNVGIKAFQIAAIYLSPQDPDYFKALNRPVALYRYRLELELVDGSRVPKNL